MTSHFFKYFFALLLGLLIGSITRAQSISLTCNEPTGCAPHGIIINAISSNGDTLASPAWTIITPTGSTLQSTANPYVAIFNVAGNYDVSVTWLGQTYLFENYITVFSKPQAIISTNDNIGCVPFCTSLLDSSIPGSGAIVSRSWDFGDGTASTEANPFHCFEQEGVFSPVLAIEDENGCFASVSAPQLITVNTQFPQALFTTGSQSSCFLPTTIEFTANNATDIVEHTWIFNNSPISETSIIQPFQFDEIGAYSICLAVENTIGCRDTFCQSIDISDEPNARFTFNRDTICAGQTLSFNNQTIPQPTSTEWDFNGNGSIDGNQYNGSFTYTTPGTYVISMTAHYGSACSVTTVDTLYVAPNPAMDFTGGPLFSCAPPVEGTFTSSEAFNPEHTYVWTVNGQFVSNEHSMSYTFLDFGSHDVRLRRYTEAGCERSRNKVDYVIIDSPDVSFDYEEFYCIGESAEVSNITIEGGETIIDYSWDFNGDGEEDAIGAQPSYTFNTPGEFMATLTVTTADGCVSIDTTDTPIRVFDTELPTFSASLTESCAGESFIFCTEYNADNTYTWDFHDGSSPQQMLAIDSCVTHIYEDTGYFDVTLTVFNGACNTFHTIEDYIHVVPPLALFDFDIVCENFTVTFENLSIEGDSIVWDFGDGSGFVINENQPVHSYAEPGEYTVVLTAYKTGTSCFDTKTQRVSVANPSTTLMLAPNVGCAPLHVQLDNTAANTFWEVTIEDGQRITVQQNDNPFLPAWTIIHEHDGQIDETSSNDPTSFDWPSLTFSSGGSFDVSVAVEDVFGCTADTTYTNAIVVWPGGDFSTLSSSVINACDNGGVLVSVNATHPNAVGWSWQFSDGTTVNAQSTEHRFTAPFDYNSGIGCTLVATDSDGCTSSQSINFGAVLPAQPLFSWQAPPVCRNEEVLFLNESLAPLGTSYEWSFGDGQSSNSSNSIYHSYSENGNYHACLKATNSVGCETEFCVNNDIEVYSPIATANFTTQLNTCLFAVSLTNTSSDNTTYTWWDFGDNQTGIGDTVLHTYPIGVYDVRLIIGASNGCSDTLVIADILNYSSSVGPFTQVLDTANCAPFGVSFQAFNVQDQLFDYFWDFNDGNGDPFGGTTTFHAYTAPGSYCPSIMMTDPNGCDVFIPCTDTIVVENYTSTVHVQEHICAQSEASIAIEHADQFTWEHPWVELGNQPNSLTVRADSSFNFLLTTRYSDCTHTQNVHVEVLPLPEVELSLVDSVCANSGIIPLMGGYPEGGQFMSGSQVTSSLNTHNYSGEHSLFSYRYTGSNGCINSAYDSVYVISPPAVETLIDRNFCEGDEAVILPQNALSYFTVDGTQSSIFPTNYTGTAAAIVNHVYDTFGCHNSASAHYFVNAKPLAEIHAENSCAQDELTIALESSVQGSNVVDVYWNIDSLHTGTGQAVDGISYNHGGQHSVEFQAVSAAGCSIVCDTTFWIYDLPTAQFSSSVACEKDTTNLTDLSVFGNDSIALWTWSFDDTSIQSSGDTAIVFNSPGNTELTLQVTTQHGCTHSVDRDITVRYTPIIETLVNDVCLGDATLFESTSTIPSGGVVDHRWAIENVPYVMQGAQALYEFTISGNYSFTFTATSNFGCSSSISESAYVFARPVISFPSGAYEYCENQEVGLLANVSVEGPSNIAGITWLLDGEVISNSNPAVFELSEIGAYVLDAIAISDRGCEATASLDQSVVVYPNPVGGFAWTVDQSTELPTIQVVANTSADVTQVAYNWGDGSSDEMDSHQYDADGSFEITQVVTNSFGCSAYHTELIDAYNGVQFYIPSAFTPDQNNYNETFLPVVSGSNLTFYVFRVFNRWGIEVFTSTNPGEGWDGTYKGEPVQDAAYNWSVDMIVRGRPDLFTKKGSVLLMR
jgi:gliding motility-associated-like protein